MERNEFVEMVQSMVGKTIERAEPDYEDAESRIYLEFNDGTNVTIGIDYDDVDLTFIFFCPDDGRQCPKVKCPECDK